MLIKLHSHPRTNHPRTPFLPFPYSQLSTAHALSNHNNPVKNEKKKSKKPLFFEKTTTLVAHLTQPFKHTPLYITLGPQRCVFIVGQKDTRDTKLTLRFPCISRFSFIFRIRGRHVSPATGSSYIHHRV